MPLAPAWLRPILVNGYAGMAFFFILSGFVLTIRYWDSAVDFRRFTVARFARIYPAFIAAFVLSFPLAIHEGAGTIILSTVANVLLIQAWTPNLFPIAINGGTWSLSVEMFFYLLFPLVFSFARNSKSKVPFWLVGLWIATFATGLVDLVNPFSGAGRFFYSAPPYRFPEFLIGIALAVAWKKKAFQPRISWPIVSGVAFVAECFSFDGFQTGNLMLLNVVAVPFFACLILYAADRQPAALNWRPLVYLGEISYGFYMFQFIFMAYVLPVLHDASTAPLAITVIGFCVTVALAAASFHLFEKPARALIRRRLSSGA
jgi:peptidoglycan/LPS O-acetylase OafA/YrhL